MVLGVTHTEGVSRVFPAVARVGIDRPTDLEPLAGSRNTTPISRTCLFVAPRDNKGADACNPHKFLAP